MGGVEGIGVVATGYKKHVACVGLMHHISRTVVRRWFPDQAPTRGLAGWSVGWHGNGSNVSRFGEEGLVDSPVAKHPQITFGKVAFPCSAARMDLVTLQASSHRCQDVDMSRNCGSTKGLQCWSGGY
jgi:hypothetical protein